MAADERYEAARKRVLRRGPWLLGKEWEERKIREYLDRERR